MFKMIQSSWLFKRTVDEKKKHIGIISQYINPTGVVFPAFVAMCTLTLHSFPSVLFAQDEEEPLPPHYFETTVNDVNGTGGKIVTRDYIDGMGRNTQSHKKINNSDQGFSSVVTGTEYDELNRPHKTVKPFGFTNPENPLEFIPKTLSSDPGCANNYYNGTSGRADAQGYPFAEAQYNDDPLGGKKIIGAPGKAYSTNTDRAIGHPVKTWYFGVPGDATRINNYLFFNSDGFILPAYLSDGPLPNSTDYLNVTIPQELSTTSEELKYFLTVSKDGNGSYSQILTDKFGKMLRSWILHRDDDDPIVSKFSYDVLGRIKVETPPATPEKNSIAPSEYSYNPLSQLKSRITPDAGTISYSYDNAGRLQETVDQLLFDSKFDLPVPGGADETIQPRLRYEYDDIGRLMTISRYEPSTIPDPPGRTKWCTWIRSVYDEPENARTFLNTSAFPQGADLDVLLAGCSNTRGRLVATISYDARFYSNRADATRIESAESIYGNKVIDFFSYDDEGRVIRKYKSIPGIPLQVRKYGYDLLGRTVADTIEFGSPVTRVITRYTYDDDGRLSTIHRNDKLYETYYYDDMGRLTKKTFLPGAPASRSVEYAYTINEWTKKIAASNEVFSEELCYETNDITDPLQTGNTFSPQYSGSISRAKATTGVSGLGSDLDVLYFYDKAGRLVQNTNNKTYPDKNTFDATYSYLNDGRFQEKHEGPDQAEWDEYTYHTKEGTSYETNKIKSIPGSGKGDASNANYIYDPNGNIVLDKSKRMAIEHDWRDMPINFYMFSAPIDASIDTWEEVKNLYTGTWTRKIVMTYDASGSRVKKETFEASVPSALQSLLVTSITGDNTLEVLAGGSFTSNRPQTNLDQTVPDGALFAANNTQTRLAFSSLALQLSGSVVDESGIPIADGDLMTRTINSDPPQLAISASGQGLVQSGSSAPQALVSGVAYVDGSHVFVRNGADSPYELSYVNFGDGISLPDNSYEFHIKDHLGSTRVVLTEDGQIKEASAYLAYGKEKEVRLAPMDTRQKYAGKEFDQDGVAYDGTGNEITKGIDLNYFGARYYDPEIGTWTSTDPADEFWNSYNYVGGDPINFVDPSGMFSTPARPVSLMAGSIGKFAGTAAVGGAFSNFVGAGSVCGLHFPPGTPQFESPKDNGGNGGDDKNDDDKEDPRIDQGMRDALEKFWVFMYSPANQPRDRDKQGELFGRTPKPNDNGTDRGTGKGRGSQERYTQNNPQIDIARRNSQVHLNRQNLNLRDAPRSGYQPGEATSLASAVTGLIIELNNSWNNPYAQASYETLNEFSDVLEGFVIIRGGFKVQPNKAIPAPKIRNPNPIAVRKTFNTRKGAEEKATRAGGGNPPVNHPNDPGQRPHFHPGDGKPKPKPLNHNHYYYPNNKK